MRDLATGLALVLVVEGLAYAILPGPMKRAMAAAMSLPEGMLRATGLIAATLGVLLVWVVRG